MRDLPVPGAVYAVSDLDAPVGTVYLNGRSRAAVFDPETLAPTIVGPSGRDSIASDADGRRVAGWISDPEGAGPNLALFSHPSFD